MDNVRIQLHKCRHYTIHALQYERPLADGSVGNGDVYNVLFGQVILWGLYAHSAADVRDYWIFQVASERPS